MSIALTITIIVLALAAFRLWVTANRLDRLHVRTEAAWAALVAALTRRVVLARALAAVGRPTREHAERLRHLAEMADVADRANRERAEWELSRGLAAVSHDQRGELADELADADERIYFAQQFYNDAVRDTHVLRASWFTRFFRLAGHAALPRPVHIADRPPE